MNLLFSRQSAVPWMGLLMLLIPGPPLVGEEPPRTLEPGQMSGNRPGEQVVNSIGQVFCWCPPGSFTMGSPHAQKHRGFDEEQVEVTFEHGFWISKFEVTEAQYKLVTNRSPKISLGDDYPYVDTKSGDAKRFAENLTKRELEEGHIPQSWTYTLPTEAQWEYACRAGTQTAFCFGDSLAKLPDHGNYADATLREHDPSTYRYADSALRDGFALAAPVGSFTPNAWNIHDMHGNVWEWCADNYAPELTGGNNPGGPEKGDGQGRVIRGGSWLSYPHYCRSAMRNAHHDLNTAPYIGIRIVLLPNSLLPEGN